MSDLPIIKSAAPRHRSRRANLATLLRCVGVVSLAVLVRLDDAPPAANEQAAPSQVVDVEMVAPLATTVDDVTPVSGDLWLLRDDNRKDIGFAALTLPQADAVTGYRGPSNILLMLNLQSQVVAVKLISSDDTPEHVEAILRAEFFFPQFHGWTLGQPHTFTEVDATSGATLTSLAMAEAIAVRLGSRKPSLKFPDNIDAADLSLVFDAPEGMTVQPIDDIEARVLASNGQPVGRLVRTGPLVDSLAGYQGPSEVIIALDTDGRTQNLALRRTYDNKPYVDYLNAEPWFWKTFQEQTLRQLSSLNLEEQQVEGVSGATMTSLAVAETIVAAARAYTARQAAAENYPQRRRVHWSRHDTGTALVLLSAIVIGMSRLRGNRRIRICWNVLLIAYFGLVTGNLISLAVVMGWAAKGSAWQLAPGLAAVIVVSVLLPVTTKRNLYCSHICPHGAAQQLLRGRFHWQTGRRWPRRMGWLPGMILLAAIVVTVLRLNWNLAAWEPFNAYIWYVAGSSSIALAVASLGLSAAVPMAYCRYGCGTGRLLEYLRRSARSDRFAAADGVLLGLLVWLLARTW